STSITVCAGAALAAKMTTAASASFEARMLFFLQFNVGNLLSVAPSGHPLNSADVIVRNRVKVLAAILVPHRKIVCLWPFINHLCRGGVSLTCRNPISMVRAAFRAAGHARPEIHASRKHG